MKLRFGKRDDLLDAAEALFARQGFVATGINQITREAGVAPMTLYNNFANKNELIQATLERRSNRFIKIFRRYIREAEENPTARILAVFDRVDRWIKLELQTPYGFGGCSFIKASFEFRDPNHPVHVVAENHKRKVIRLFEDSLRTGSYPDPVKLALTLQLLMDGAIVQAHMFADENSVYRARAVAEVLLTTVD